MKFKPGQLVAILGCPKATEDKWITQINDTCDKYQINTVLRLAAFIAQVGHESGRLRLVEENLNYSADGLKNTFSKYFTAETAAEYARKPEKIANRVYASRMGNGPEASGEGYKYRGRGLIQCTGKSNYNDCARSIGVDCVSSPELLVTPQYAAMSAGWFWNSKSLNDYADRKDIVSITKKINGGTNGLEERKSLYERAIVVLNGDDPEAGKPEDVSKKADAVPAATTEPIESKSTPGAVNTVINEPPIGESEYPYNAVFESRSGHVTQIDDTPGKEKLSTSHRTGSYWAINPLGTYTHKSVLDSYKITKNDSYDFTGGNYTAQIKGQSFFTSEGQMVFKTPGTMFLQAPRVQVNTSMMAVAGEMNAKNVKTPLVQATFSDTLASEAMVAWSIRKGKGGSPILGNSLGFAGTPGTESLRANNLSKQKPDGTPIVSNGITPAIVAAAVVAGATFNSGNAAEALASAGVTTPEVEKAINGAAGKLDAASVEEIAETPVFVKHVAFDKPTLMSQSTVADAPDPALYHNNIHTIVDENGRGDIYISDGTIWRPLGSVFNGALNEFVNELDGRVTQETAERVAAILAEAQARTDAIAAESVARQAALLAESNARLDLADDLAAEAAARVTAINNEALLRQQDIVAESVARANALIAEAGSRASAIAAEASARAAAIAASADAIGTTITNVQTQIEGEIDSLASVVDTLAAVNLDYVAAIQTESDARVSADSALASRIDTVVADSDALTAAVTSEVQARIDADEALGSRIDTIVVDNEAGYTAMVQAEATARINADNALASSITTVSANVASNGAAIINEANTRADADSALAEDLDYVISTTDITVAAVRVLTQTQAAADTSLAEQFTELTATLGGNASVINERLTALTTADTALATSISNLTTTVNGNITAISNEQSSRTTADTALGTRIDTLTTRVGTSEAALITEQTARSTQDTALAQSITNLTTTVGGNTTAISSEVTARSNADSALGTRIDNLTTTVNGNTTAITTETTARTTADTALGTQITTVDTRVNGVVASVTSEATARSTADTALGTRIDTLTTRVGTAETTITSETTARTTADTALGTRIDNVTTTVGNNLTLLQTETTARTTADTALGTRIDTLTTRVGTAEAAATSEVTARTTADTALGSRIDTLTSRVGTTESSIVSEQTTRANADTALSNSLSSLSTTVGGHTTSITTQTSSINGIQAKYGVKVDNNGYISGFGLISEPNNGVPVSQFNILADKFAVVKPNLNGGAPVVPFLIDTTTTPATITFDAFIRNNTVNLSPNAATEIYLAENTASVNLPNPQSSGASLPLSEFTDLCSFTFVAPATCDILVSVNANIRSWRSSSQQTGGDKGILGCIVDQFAPSSITSSTYFSFGLTTGVSGSLDKTCVFLKTKKLSVTAGQTYTYYFKVGCFQVNSWTNYAENITMRLEVIKR